MKKQVHVAIVNAKTREVRRVWTKADQVEVNLFTQTVGVNTVGKPWEYERFSSEERLEVFYAII